MTDPERPATLAEDSAVSALSLAELPESEVLAGKQSTDRFEKRYRHIVWPAMNTVLLRDPVSSKPLHLITDLVDITES